MERVSAFRAGTEATEVIAVPHRLAPLVAHPEAQQGLLEAVAHGQVENPVAEVREFLTVVGTFTICVSDLSAHAGGEG